MMPPMLTIASLPLNDRELRVLCRVLHGEAAGDAEALASLRERVEEIIADNIGALERIAEAEGTGPVE